MSRRSFQILKKDDPSEVSPSNSLEGDSRKKTIAKSRFGRSPKHESNHEELSTYKLKKMTEPILEDNQFIAETSNPNVLMTVSTMNYLNTDEMKNSIEDKFKGIIPENSEKKEMETRDLFIKIPKVDVSMFKFTEENKEDIRTRSRTGNFDNKTKSNLAGKLINIQMKKTIKELKHPNLDDVKNEEEYLSSPKINMGSPTMKKQTIMGKEVSSNQQQLKSQVKFLNSAVLTFSLMLEFVQKLTDEGKLPHNIDFWYNEQKTNLEFLIGKLAESEFSEEYIQKGDNIKKFNEKLLETAKVLFFFFFFLGGGGGTIIGRARGGGE